MSIETTIEEMESALQQMQEQLTTAYECGWHKRDDEVAGLMVKVTYYETVLNTIASWGEGDTVSDSFDEPYAAEMARGALVPESDIAATFDAARQQQDPHET